MEEIELILEEAKEKMDAALAHLEKSFIKIRAGKANPAMLSGVMVEYYGSQTPLNQVANVSAQDAFTLTVQPWEKKTISDIERAIINSNLGFAPSNNGEMVIINLPQLTEERRQELVKQAKAEAEDAKVGIRNARKEANNQIKDLDVAEDLKSNTEIDVQELTDQFVAKTEKMLEAKSKEILTV